MYFTQTTALFVDAYRELNARRLFWITLIISAVVVLAFAAVGINDNGFTLFWKQIPSDTINTRFIDRATAYKSLFEELGVNLWLTWGAMLLALVSTANLFPDFLTGGSVDLYLSKPIGRVRLFGTKFLTGLLFVAMQVVAFCAASYLVLGLRGGVWVPAVFIAVPLVLLIFSYLYAVMTCLGILTRSTIASLLLTVVFWTVTVLLAQTNHWLWQLSIEKQLELHDADVQIDADRHQIDDLRANGAELTIAATTHPTAADARLQLVTASLNKLQQDRAEMSDSFAIWHRASAAVIWPLPKTTQTYQLIQRIIGERMRLHPDRRRELQNDNGDARQQAWFHRMQLMQQAERRVTELESAQSSFYVVGTSLGFEALIVLGSCWVFWRRDY